MQQRNKFSPGDSVVVIIEDYRLVGNIVSESYPVEFDFGVVHHIQVSVENNEDDDLSSEVLEVPVNCVRFACFKCFGKGVIDVGFEMKCPVCDGNGLRK